MESQWHGLPYRPISQHYKILFGEKVYKIPVSVVDDCPNRMGLKGMQTCIFCDEWGSAARAESLVLPLKDQIEKYHALIQKKYKAKAFLIYFQAYTNTFTKLTALKANFETALSYDFVKGLVVGTRPDCISKGVLDLWTDAAQRTHLAIELGVQSFSDEDLLFLRRGHSVEDVFKSIKNISAIPKIDLGIHLIFGLPNETDSSIIETAKICNSLPITNVKLHNLHVLKNTPLAELYARGEFTPADFELYCHRVSLFLEHLSPHIFIQRLAAYSSRWNELVAPAWTADKMKTHQGLIDYLRQHESYQSRQYKSGSSEDDFAILKIQQQASRIDQIFPKPKGLKQ